MGLQVVMISCRQRRETERPKTLASLRAVGITPTVFESPCDPPHPRENRRVSLFALRCSRGRDTLFLEDDIDVDDTFPLWIEAARAQPHLVTFCVMRMWMQPPHVSAAVRLGRPIPTGLFPIPRLDKWYGTQAIYLPAQFVDWAVEHPAFMAKSLHKGEVTWTGFDLFIRDHLRETNMKLLGAFPNPVQHRDPPKLVQRAKPPPERKSLTYGLPRAGDIPVGR